jgi:REP element-mobilizing transposase RayT
MPRLARAVFAHVPHHITQRGKRREDVFFTDDDKKVYLAWLKAYCLMTNHVHLIAVPATGDALERVLTGCRNLHCKMRREKLTSQNALQSIFSASGGV